MLYPDTLYKAVFIKPISNTTILVKRKYLVQPSKILIEIRGIRKDIETDPLTLNWLKTCFDAYDNRLVIARASPLAERISGIRVYKADVLMDNNIGLDTIMISARHACRESNECYL